jgi:hypothetical protein
MRQSEKQGHDLRVVWLWKKAIEDRKRTLHEASTEVTFGKGCLSPARGSRNFGQPSSLIQNNWQRIDGSHPC